MPKENIKPVHSNDIKVARERRSPFVRWLFRQKDRQDPKTGLRHPIADLADDVLRRPRIPNSIKLKEGNQELFDF